MVCRVAGEAEKIPVVVVGAARAAVVEAVAERAPTGQSRYFLVY